MLSKEMTLNQEKILLVGAGGHAKACIDVIEQGKRFIISGLVGTARELGDYVLGYPVVGTDADLSSLLTTHSHALVTTGHIESPDLRIHLFQLLKQIGYSLPVLISPKAYVSPHATIGAGTIIMHGAVINAGAKIGRNCILNSQSLIEHDVVVSDHCHISTGACVNGNVSIGAGTFIGSQSSIRQGLKIGDRCLIGMGQRVLADLDSGLNVPVRKKIL